MFREEVVDRTVLSLKVMGRDAASGFQKFLLGLFSTVLDAGFAAVRHQGRRTLKLNPGLRK
jgi:hypothetical protein